MKDRQPTPGMEGRMLITPEDGSSAFYAVISMADNPLDDGTPLSKETLLKDETAALHGLGVNAVPDDIFSKLALPFNHYGFKVTVSLASGCPVSGCVLPSDFVDMHGNSGVVTDEYGVAYCALPTNSITFKFGSEDFGIKEKSYTFTADEGKPFTSVSIVLENNTDLEDVTLLETSVSYKLLDNIESVDLCAVGGGGGGGANIGSINKGGGAGGQAVNCMEKTLSGKIFSIIIGAGGDGVLTAGSGGNTTCSLDDTVFITASGGAGGANNAVSYGNGNGGFTSAGTNGTVRVFNDPSLPLPGGGGGHGVVYSNNKYSRNAGGSDFGGAGGGYAKNEYIYPSAGSGPGGGGGGSNYGTSGNRGGAYGHSGGVYMRVRFKQ